MKITEMKVPVGEIIEGYHEDLSAKLKRQSSLVVRSV